MWCLFFWLLDMCHSVCLDHCLCPKSFQKQPCDSIENFIQYSIYILVFQPSAVLCSSRLSHLAGSLRITPLLCPTNLSRTTFSPRFYQSPWAKKKQTCIDLHSFLHKSEGMCFSVGRWAHGRLRHWLRPVVKFRARVTRWRAHVLLFFDNLNL